LQLFITAAIYYFCEILQLHFYNAEKLKSYKVDIANVSYDFWFAYVN